MIGRRNKNKQRLNGVRQLILRFEVTKSILLKGVAVHEKGASSLGLNSTVGHLDKWVYRRQPLDSFFS